MEERPTPAEVESERSERCGLPPGVASADIVRSRSRRAVNDRFLSLDIRKLGCRLGNCDPTGRASRRHPGRGEVPLGTRGLGFSLQSFRWRRPAGTFACRAAPAFRGVAEAHKRGLAELRAENFSEPVAMLCVAGLCGAAGHSNRGFEQPQGGARPNFL